MKPGLHDSVLLQTSEFREASAGVGEAGRELLRYPSGRDRPSRITGFVSGIDRWAHAALLVTGRGRTEVPEDLLSRSRSFVRAMGKVVHLVLVGEVDWVAALETGTS